MVERVAGTKGVAGGELCGGLQFREFWGSGLWCFSISAEGVGGSTRLRGEGWKHGRGLGTSVLAGFHRSEAAAEPVEDEKDGRHQLIAGYGGSRGLVWGCLRAWTSSGPLK